MSINDWHIREIEELITTSLENPARCFCFFIDGLDELEIQRQMEDDEILLHFIGRVSASTNVKCCLSSRPEQLFEVFFRQTKQLRLEKLNEDDIRQLCGDSLEQAFEETNRDLNNTELDHLKDLVHAITHRASGVFLWAHLVLAQLRRGIRAHDEVLELHKYLDTLPSEISKLYEHMLAKNNEDLPQHREEAANFINLVLLVENLRSKTDDDLARLSLVQFALTLDKDLQSSSAVTLKSSDVVEACVKLNKRVSVRSASLLHVVDDNNRAYWPAWQCTFPDEIGHLHKFSIDLIHRTAKDFLLTESVGKAICSKASISNKGLYRQFFHALLLDQSLWTSLISYRWLEEFVELLRVCSDSFDRSETAKMIEILEKACMESVQKFSTCKDPHNPLSFLQTCCKSLIKSTSELFLLDFNAMTFRFGLSSSVWRSIELGLTRLNPNYCAYLLCICSRWNINGVDQHFVELVLTLLGFLELTSDNVIYPQCTVAYPLIHPHQRGELASIDLFHPNIHYHDYGPNSRSGVRRSIGGGLMEMMFSTTFHGHALFEFHEYLPFATSFLNACPLPSAELSLVIINDDEDLSVGLPDPRHVRAHSKGLGLLIEYDVREVFWLYQREAQRTHIEREVYSWSEFIIVPADHRWNITVKAVLDVAARKWCTPYAADRDALSEMLSRFPTLPCSIGLHTNQSQIDLDDEYWKSLSQRATEACERADGPARDLVEVLAEIEYIIPPDDPRVLRRAPPMFLDDPVKVESESEDKDKGENRDGTRNERDEDKDETDDDGSDEFFDADG